MQVLACRKIFIYGTSKEMIDINEKSNKRKIL